MTAKKGKLTVITGCMTSGKSHELLQALQQAGRTVQAFVPKSGSRSGASVSSRSGLKRSAIVIDELAEFVRAGALDAVTAEVVGFDEAHFFDDSLITAVRGLVERDVDVIVAGLDVSYRAEPFGPLPQLLALADEVVKLTAVCAVCGRPATLNQRLVGSLPADAQPGSYLGGDESYQPRCRDCHEVPKD
jgi:thymidine kinase